MHPIALVPRALEGLARGAGIFLDRLFPHRTVAGVFLVDNASIDHNLGLEPLDRLEDAWRLLNTVDPRRASLVRRHVSRISIMSMPSRGGAWYQSLRRICISLRVVMDHPAATTASLIVHEMTHARLRRWGIRYPPSLRARVERACDREQIRFLSRLPEAMAIMQGYEARLGRLGPTDQELTDDWIADMRAAQISEPVIEKLLRLRAQLEPHRLD